MEEHPSTSLRSKRREAFKIFYSYAREDELWREKVEKHLSLLKREHLITSWNDRDIKAGDEWKHEIDENLQRAEIVLLLISSDFVASDYCYSIEMKFAMKKHKAKEAKVIPIILRPVDWHKAMFGVLQALPKDGKAVTTWENEDEAFYNIAIGIRAVIKEMQKKY